MSRSSYSKTIKSTDLSKKNNSQQNVLSKSSAKNAFKSTDSIQKNPKKQEMLSKSLKTIKSSNSPVKNNKNLQLEENTIDTQQENMQLKTATQKLQKIKTILQQKMEEKNQLIDSDKLEIVKLRNYFDIIDNIRSAHKCFQCHEFLEDPRVCASNCCKKFCRFCAIDGLKCPNPGCNQETLLPDEITSNLIFQIKIKCTLCGDEMLRESYDAHFKQHKYDCLAKDYGCNFFADKKTLYSHYPECNFFNQKRVDKKLELFSSMLEGMQNILNQF